MAITYNTVVSDHIQKKVFICTDVEKISKTSYLKKKRKFQNNMYTDFF